MKRVLVIGSGGREHALCWKLAQEAEVHCLPGNPGIAEVAHIHSGDPLEVAQAIGVDLVVVGPENPLIDGLADRLRDAGIAVFGPGAAGAQLEGSKAFSKELMRAAGIPTAEFDSFTDVEAAKSFALQRIKVVGGVAVKASGNALGKGVVLCRTQEEADDALEAMMVERQFGEAGATVVVEDLLDGREFSLLTVVSGQEYRSLPVAQDYKRALDGDRGPNTGGMGSYSPVSWVSEDLVRETEAKVVQPLLAELASRGIEFRGLLFSGLMVVDHQPFCLEYNVRFGDPETQSILPRIGRGFLDLLSAAAEGKPLPSVEVLEYATCTLVLASGGYPGNYEKGKPISLPGPSEKVMVFHAGTAIQESQFLTAGGRVLNVVSWDISLERAKHNAYEYVKNVRFEGMFYRSDIAQFEA